MRAERFNAAATGLRIAARSLAMLARRQRDLAEELLAEELPWLTWLPEAERHLCVRTCSRTWSPVPIQGFCSHLHAAVGDALRYKAGPVELPTSHRVAMRPDSIFDLARCSEP